jgi:hypothetical protein
MKIPIDQQHDDQQAGQTAFDIALRKIHADAVAQVSARTQAQLHQRRRAALSAQSSTAAGAQGTARRFGWPLAASFAAILAVVVGVQMRQDSLPASPSPALVTSETDDIGATIATLDENPDFYLWLASTDAVALASE